MAGLRVIPGPDRSGPDIEVLPEFDLPQVLPRDGKLPRAARSGCWLGCAGVSGAPA
jgi:hypothetical protein